MASTRRRYPSKNSSSDPAPEPSIETPTIVEITEEAKPEPTPEPVMEIPPNPEPVFVERVIKPQPVPESLFEQKAEPEAPVPPAPPVTSRPRGEKLSEQSQKKHPRNVPKFSRLAKG